MAEETPLGTQCEQGRKLALRIFDIGGSGIKTARLYLTSNFETLGDQEVEYYDQPNWVQFPQWAHNDGLLDYELIGISCAGFIENNQIVKYFRAARWLDKPLVKEIAAFHPSSEIYVLNDAEAHLIAHNDLYPTPCMAISLGTSLGFSISDQNGSIIRPSDGLNFDVGDLSLPVRASNKKVWWAMGTNGLAELQRSYGREHGIARFGDRLGVFLANICSIFRPTAVVLSGGITESGWKIFKQPMLKNCQIKNWLPPVTSFSPSVYIQRQFGLSMLLLFKV